MMESGLCVTLLTIAAMCPVVPTPLPVLTGFTVSQKGGGYESLMPAVDLTSSCFCVFVRCFCGINWQ